MSAKIRKIVIDKSKANIHGEYELEEKEIKEFFESEYIIIEKIYEDLKVKKNIGNNIIAILGDRGAGKSSFMKSFLKHINKEKNITLGPIDPSKFTKHCNILEIILGTLFNEFKKEIEKNSEDIRYDDKRNLLEKFEKTFKNIKYIKNRSNDTISEIDELLEISGSFKLKENVTELVGKYLEDVLKNKDGKLIIAIDDIDLNSRYAYEMLEDIRKYLISDNIIILIATKIEQLADVIKENYLKEYIEMSKFGKDGIKEEVEDRVNKYLTKLLPYDRRVYLASPFDDECSDIYIGRGKDKIEIHINSRKEEKRVTDENEIESIKKYLNKCYGNIFYEKDNNKKENRVMLLPNNLRELIFFILKTEDIESDENKLKKFKEFFIKYWIEEKLNFEDKKTMITFIELEDINEKNDYIYRELIKKLKQESLIKETGGEKELEDERDITLGDVRNLINILRRNYKEKKIIFAMEILYSIYLIEGKFEHDKRFKLDRDIDSLGENADYILFKKFKHNYEKLKNEDKNKDENIGTIVECIEKIFDIEEITDDEKKDKRAVREKERRVIKDLNYGNFIANIQGINSEKLVLVEEKIKEKLNKKNLLVNVKKVKRKKELSGNLNDIYEIFKTLEINIKENLIKEWNKEKLIELIGILDTKIDKENFLEILVPETSIDEGIDELNQKFDEYKREFIDFCFEKRKFKYQDFFNDILFLINKNDLKYFLRGSKERIEEIYSLNDKMEFFGVVGGFHIFSKIKEKTKKMKEEISGKEEQFLEYKSRKSKLESEIKKLEKQRVEIQVKYSKIENNINKDEIKLEELFDKNIEKIILDTKKINKDEKEQILENMYFLINERLKSNRKQLEEYEKQLDEKYDELREKEAINKENEEILKKLEKELERDRKDINGERKKIQELFEIIQKSLDEQGSLKELLHLNECDPNEEFYSKEVDKLDKFTEREWFEKEVIEWTI